MDFADMTKGLFNMVKLSWWAQSQGFLEDRQKGWSQKINQWKQKSE